MKNPGIKIQGIPVIQNDQEFIIGKIRIEDLLKFTKYTERVIIGYDEEERPIYNNHIQRKVEASRVNKIADFLINDKDATFPTNIVLGVPIGVIEEQSKNGILVDITFSGKVSEEILKSNTGDKNADVYITIIDGQHRMRGIEIAIERLNKEIKNETNAEKSSKLAKILYNLLNIELVVSYFIDKSLEYQAMIFSTINRTQKRVSQDLVYSLFGLSNDDTPYKTALEIVLALNGHEKSPFYKRIKLYGGNYDRRNSPPLSQATMIKNIVGLICESLRESENDKYRKRKELLKRTNNKFLPFRKLYATNKDSEIANCLFYFFNSVKNILNGYWIYDGVSNPQNILQSTVGFESLLMLMTEIIRVEQVDDFNTDTFDKYITRLKGIKFDNVAEYPMSPRGRRILFLQMSLLAIPTNDVIDTRMDELNRLRIES